MPICGGSWLSGASAGVFGVILHSDRSNVFSGIGFCSALPSMPDQQIVLTPKICGKYKGISCPDMLVGDSETKWDIKELTGISKDAIRNAIKRKADQAGRFIIDIAENGIIKVLKQNK